LKGIFGFLTGAAIGAAGLVGLRKALKILDGPESRLESSGNVNLSSSSSHEVKPVAPPAGETNDGAFASKEQPVLDASLSAGQTVAEPVSLVGEPVERHLEPQAATQTEPEAATPRSETSEPPVPENPVVEPAPQTTPVKTENAANGRTNGAKKTSKAAANSRSDDLTVIIDIGPVFNQKLRAAGIKSFKALAQLTAGQIEEKTGIPAERVERGQWIEQARKLATQAEKK
jgi:predicted flap endonuclease-1-like 5' DNA nuclease